MIVSAEGRAKVVRELSRAEGLRLFVEQGERVVICGPPPGKSTLIRCINGLEHVTPEQSW